MRRCTACSAECGDGAAINCPSCRAALPLRARPLGDWKPSPSQILDTEVWKLLNSGKRSEAIQLVRQRKQCGMAEARSHVDALDSGGTQPVSVGPIPPSIPQHPVRVLPIVAGILGGIAITYVLVASGYRLLLTSNVSAVPVTKEFEFAVQGGQRVVATTQLTVRTTEKRFVVFTPFIGRTDGNLYQAALQSLWHLYGKERGLFQLQDASAKAEPGLGGNAICWKVANPTSDYCVFRVKDEASQKLAALTIWVE